MSKEFPASPHEFYIPVMGTSFTVDTPLHAAPFGISSSISLVDDILIEQMRKFHSEKANLPYHPIHDKDQDARAKRITAYLNLLDRLVAQKTKALQASPFEPDSPLTKYFDMLPNSSSLKKRYLNMMTAQNSQVKQAEQNALRKLAVPGSIDVNIMTKLDRLRYRDNKPLPPEFSDALAALRGYANSSLHSSIIFSAGFNPQLYGYLSQFPDFFPNENSIIKKKIILKVSDYRSAMIQGKYLAKRGLWISEFRIESALNCGGHAFANDGHLMGPILEEFKSNREALIDTLYKLYAKTQPHTTSPPDVHITVQGGIGTNNEHEFLLQYYKLNQTGWATPFMLVPEVVNIHENDLKKLQEATEEEVKLSNSSPLGIPFWTLTTSSSEINRKNRIAEGHPGSPCPKKYAEMNTEFTQKPICIASQTYQKLKLNNLKKQSNLNKTVFEILKKQILDKACICHDLAGNATLKYGIDLNAKPAICCGPNIINFTKIATLKEMIDHIYGQLSLLTHSDRPHMFIKELMLHIEYLKKETKESLLGLLTRPQQKLREVKENLINGIEYYQNLAKQTVIDQQENFLAHLRLLHAELESISFPERVE